MYSSSCFSSEGVEEGGGGGGANDHQNRDKCFCSPFSATKSALALFTYIEVSNIMVSVLCHGLVSCVVVACFLPSASSSALFPAALRNNDKHFIIVFLELLGIRNSRSISLLLLE